MDKNLKILYLNARSLKNKMEEVEIMINEEKIDVMVVSETWVTKNETKYYNFKMYNSVYATRKKRGGGLGIFINKKISFEVLEKCENTYSYISIKIHSPEVYLCGLYKPPSVKPKTFFEFLEEKLENLNKIGHDCFVLGDININIFKNNEITKQLLDVYTSNNFKMGNKITATRKTKNTSTLIDHIITNTNKKIKLNLKVSPLSDHLLQFLEILNENNTTNTTKYKQIYVTKYNTEKLKMKLNNLNLIKHLFEKPNELYEAIIDSFSLCSSIEVLKIKRNSEVWFNQELYKLIKQRNNLYEKTKKYPESEEHLKKL